MRLSKTVRFACACLLLACKSPAQFRSNVPLVVTPATITDSKGHYVDGLTTENLVLYDNSVPQTVQLDWTMYPISLVVAVQTSSNAGAVIDKIGGSGILLTQLLAADAGQTAMISFSDEVRIHQQFTSSPDLLTHSLRMLRKEGDDAHLLDAMRAALVMLEGQPAGQRRIILMIAERRDRGSEVHLPEVMARVQRLNATVYWLTWSPFLQPFTVRPKTAEDLKPEAERIRVRKCALCPGPDDTGVPFDAGPGGLLYGIQELIRLQQPDLSSLFSNATGGHTLNFLKKGALEQAIQLVGEEVHRQYLVSFQPKAGAPGAFHTVRLEVKDRPDLHVRTRAGYWTVE